MKPRSTKITLPRTLRGLRPWLTQTDEGRALLASLTDECLEERCRACQEGWLAIPRVLVVLRRLGRYPGAEVYQTNGVTVRLEELVDTQDDAELERLADELLEVQLPRTWQSVAQYGRRKSMVFTSLSAERRIRSLEELETIRELKECLSRNVSVV